MRKHACKRKRGCIRKDAPAGAGDRQIRDFSPSFALNPEDRSAPEAIAATACAKRKAQRADV
ncbi:MAG: hypothetical protein IKK58_01280, partial [Clostridia bacterium]|nr:hypothetical protein [Clostridia bacterium]